MVNHPSHFKDFLPDLILGAIFVFLFAIDRISMPKMNMESTTSQRYWGFILSYAASSTIPFFIAASILVYVTKLHHIFDINKMLAFLPKPDLENNLSPPLLIALFMTVLLPKIPGLAKLDEALRTYFRRNASMSGIASHLSHIIEKSPFNYSDSKRDEIRKYLMEQNLECKDVKFDDDGSPQYLWTRINILLFTIKNWETNIIYSAFLDKFNKEWKSLIDDCEAHEEKAIRCFRLGCIAGDDDKLNLALKDCRNHYSEQLQGLLVKLSDFIGRGIAQCNRSPESRRQALIAIGINSQDTIIHTLDKVTWVFVMVLVTTLVALMFSNLSQSASKPTDYDFIFKIAFSFACASLAALYSFHHKTKPLRPLQNRAWDRYFIVGLIAVILATVLNMTQGTLDIIFDSDETGNIFSVFTTFIDHTWIFQIRTFALGMVLSYLLDAPPKSNPRIQQWTETAITALVMFGTAYIIMYYYNSLLVITPGHKLGLRFLLLSLVLGGLVGYWLPTNVRRSLVAAQDPAARPPAESSATTVN